ncbi:MAG TPA: hypothetical protein VG937_22005 [Polyangiaceae bacterium]|jgi:hypothetical protein|nr:hypothetical protein [Polyangiaceae bacterium]
MDGDRYDRQRRLRQVGPAGQLRIERSEATIPAGAAAAVALAYLTRAGVERAIIEVRPDDAFSHSTFFRFSGPRTVAQGAEGALRHLLKSLELS